jgi:hypothetical protein
MREKIEKARSAILHLEGYGFFGITMHFIHDGIEFFVSRSDMDGAIRATSVPKLEAEVEDDLPFA